MLRPQFGVEECRHSELRSQHWEEVINYVTHMRIYQAIVDRVFSQFLAFMPPAAWQMYLTETGAALEEEGEEERQQRDECTKGDQVRTLAQVEVEAIISEKENKLIFGSDHPCLVF
ncbi:hypothetical protein YC2023_053845 [Brassica napus]